MDNNRLNDLFNQAKNEAPKASCDEIKRQFEQSILTAGASASTSLFTLKNVLMIATISTLSVATIMVLDTATAPHPTTNPTNLPQPEQVIQVESVEKEHAKTMNRYMERVERLDPVLKMETQIELKLALKTAQPAIILQQLNQSKEEGERRKNKVVTVDTSFRFPSLTPEEIKANNKQKAKMMKQLIKQDKKAYAYIPSVTTTLKGEKVSIQAFYMQTTEVSNLEYRTFLFDLLIQGRKDDFMKARPIQETWSTEYNYAFMKPMEESYFSHPAYNDYPVVAIPRVGAQLYCKWLTKQVNKINVEKGKPLINDLRLPSDIEWMYAAKGGLERVNYPWSGGHLRNYKGLYMANYKPKKDNYIEDGGFYQVLVKSYFPNGYGLYCMSGNVAEMIFYTSENNLPGTKGGSWSSEAQELQIEDGEDRFKGRITPSVNIGFRPVITYLGKPK